MDLPLASTPRSRRTKVRCTLSQRPHRWRTQHGAAPTQRATRVALDPRLTPDTVQHGLLSMLDFVVLWMGPSQGSQIGKDETPTTETTERTSQHSHSTAEGLGNLPHFVSPSPLRQPCTSTAPAERPRAPRQPEARAQGGPVEPRLASAFFSPATRPTAMTSNV